jgi:hypothetical protein
MGTRAAGVAFPPRDEVEAYCVAASDGEIGHVEDFFIDDQDWAIQLLAIDTGNWLPGRKVVISPRWLCGIDWPGRRIEVDLSRQQIKDSPAYAPRSPPRKPTWSSSRRTTTAPGARPRARQERCPADRADLPSTSHFGEHPRLRRELAAAAASPAPIVPCPLARSALCVFDGPVRIVVHEGGTGWPGPH